MSLLIPDFGLLFWMFISFAIVFCLLAKFGFPVITRSVNERREYILQSLAKADEANRSLESIKQQSEEILNEARRQQQDTIKQAANEASRLIQQANEDAVVQGKKKLAEAIRMIDVQKQKAIGEIRTQVAMLSVDIAEKILRHQLDISENHDRLLSEMLDEIEHSEVLRN